MPKCGFRTHERNLLVLHQHLLESHDSKGRERFAYLLANSGYDHASANVRCPICPDSSLFDHHKDFHDHFLITHCPHPRTLSKDELIVLNKNYCRLQCYLRDYQVIPDELRKHRRAILSIYPEFEHHPVWNDINRCPS